MLVVILLGIFGVVVLGKLGGANNNVAVHQSPSTHATGSPKSSPSPSPSNKGPLTVPTYGPNAAAPITKVQFCSIAVPCAIAHGVADETATVLSFREGKVVQMQDYRTTGDALAAAQAT